MVFQGESQECEETGQHIGPAKNTQVLSKKRKKKDNTTDDPLLTSAIEILQKQPDDNDIFGQYVATELRSLRTDANKRRLKSAIRRSIDQIADGDDMYAASSSSVSTPMPSPQFFEVDPSLNQQNQPGTSSTPTCATYYQTFTNM